jgi:hypothetical protein
VTVTNALAYYRSVLITIVKSVILARLSDDQRISRKQSARWQHLSWLKASALFFLQNNVSCMKRNNLYSGLVTPSSG